MSATKYIFCILLILPALSPSPVLAQAAALSNPKGFSAPTGFSLGSAQVFIDSTLKTELTDNEKYEADATAKDGDRSTASLNLLAQGKSGDTSYYASLGASYYYESDEAGDDDSNTSFPIGAGLTHLFNSTDTVSLTVGQYWSNESFAPVAGASPYDLQVMTSNVGANSTVKLGNYLLKADGAWTGAEYEYKATKDESIDVKRDEYDYNASIGKQYTNNLVSIGIGGSTSTGETAAGVDVDSQQIQVGFSAQGAFDAFGYAANLVYGHIRYNVDSIENQQAVLGAIQASYQVATTMLLRAEFDRTFANSILTDEAGYITTTVAVSGQYDFSQHTFVRPKLAYEYTEVLSTEQDYTKTSFSVTLGQHVTDNVSAFLAYTYTQQDPNRAAAGAGFTKYEENKVLLELSSTF